MQYVATVREHIKKGPIEEAVPQAVDECIEKGILKDFLLRNKAEVVAMSIFEYNEEEELRKLRASEFRGAYKKAREEVRKEVREEVRKEVYDAATLQERIDCIFELLQEYGEIPDDLKQKISSQRDKAVLIKWHKLAARADSIEEFEEKIGANV